MLTIHHSRRLYMHALPSISMDIADLQRTNNSEVTP